MFLELRRGIGPRRLAPAAPAMTATGVVATRMPVAARPRGGAEGRRGGQGTGGHRCPGAAAPGGRRSRAPSRTKSRTGVGTPSGGTDDPSTGPGALPRDRGGPISGVAAGAVVWLVGPAGRATAMPAPGPTIIAKTTTDQP